MRDTITTSKPMFNLDTKLTTWTEYRTDSTGTHTLYNDMIGYQIGYPGSDEMTIGLDRAFFFNRGEALHTHARAVLTRLARLTEGASA